MSQPDDLRARIQAGVRAIQTATRRDRLPDTAVVLGSGFKGFERLLDQGRELPASSLPHFPVPRVAGHGASLAIGGIGGREVCILTGRAHMYEGHAAHAVVYPIRVLAAMGVRNLLLTNACGSVDPDVRPGDVVLIRDQLNLTGRNCLAEDGAHLLAPIFVDMGQPFDAGWRHATAARAAGVQLRDGVYAGLLGPTYETPAETAMLHRLGATVVGMSTVQEVIAARHLGMRCQVLSFVTNMAGGLGGSLQHQDVIDLVEAHRLALHRLLVEAIGAAP